MADIAKEYPNKHRHGFEDNSTHKIGDKQSDYFAISEKYIFNDKDESKNKTNQMSCTLHRSS